MAILNLSLANSSTQTISSANADATNTLNITALSGAPRLIVDGVTVSLNSLVGVTAGSIPTFQTQNGGRLVINEGLVNVSALSQTNYVVSGTSSIQLNGGTAAVGLASAQNVSFAGAGAGNFTFLSSAGSAVASPITFNVSSMGVADSFNVQNSGLVGGTQTLELNTAGGAAYRDGVLHLSSGTGPGNTARDVYVNIAMSPEQAALFFANQASYLSGQNFTFPAGPQYGTEAGEVINGTGLSDIIYGGPNDGSPETGTGNDTINAGAGNDTVYAGDGDDVVFGGAGNDLIYGGDGNDILYGGTGNDVIYGGAGNDTIIGGPGANALYGGDGFDILDYSASNAAVNVNLGTGAVSGGHASGDTISGFEGVIGSGFNDVLTGGAGNEAFYGGTGNDTIFGGGGDDTINGGIGSNRLFGGAGNDLFIGSSGGDLLDGGSGFDTVDYSASNAGVNVDLGAGTGSGGYAAGDTLVGIDGVIGSSFDDTLRGNADANVIRGGAGNDTIYYGHRDTVFGGSGDDTFYFDAQSGAVGNSFVYGGSGNDTLHLGSGRWQREFAAGSTQNGVVRYFDDQGNVTHSVTFEGIEQIICFTPGTMILTEAGERRIETLSIGDRVVTRDHGPQPVRWIGTRTVPATGSLAPIRLEAGFLPDLRAPLLVSPMHRVLMTGYRAELLFGTNEVLAAAGHLLNDQTVRVQRGGMVTYVHMIFDRHQIIYANGAATESFFPGDVGIGALDDACRDELFAIFPELRSHPSHYGQTARRALKAYEAGLLVA